MDDTKTNGFALIASHPLKPRGIPKIVSNRAYSCLERIQTPSCRISVQCNEIIIAVDVDWEVLFLLRWCINHTFVCTYVVLPLRNRKRTPAQS
jgi:hypothetical protein